MTHEQKINYMRIAASLSNFGFTNQQLDLLVSFYELVITKKGNASVDDVVRIEHAVKDREAGRLQEASKNPK